jgi:hypothetical protein
VKLESKREARPADDAAGLSLMDESEGQAL